MSGSNTLSKAFLCAMTATALVVATAEGAAAATYDKQFASGYGGSGRINGELHWPSKSSFTYDSYVQDICPGDGLGVSYYFNYSDTGGTTRNTGYIDWDTNGCGNGIQNEFGTVSRAYNITQVRVVACFTDNGNLCAFVPLDGVTVWKVNPNI